MQGCSKGDGFEPEPETPPVEEETPPATAPDFPAYEWPELPVIVANDNFTYLTHFCSAGGRQMRNYTLCFDRTKAGAWWVAYPLHSVYMGSGRPNPDPWDYDPDIDKSWQANLLLGSYTGSYDRGHQIPNADRNADKAEGGMCYQTFYSSNSTPQSAELNQNAWADLEGLVRNWSRNCSDTLYVVTGACWQGTPVQTTDRAGKACPIPSHYFKVVARTVKGNIRKAGDRLGDYTASELQTIGFWVENKASEGSKPPKGWVRSVAEIETLSGFTFFPTLPAEVKTQKNTSAWPGL